MSLSRSFVERLMAEDDYPDDDAPPLVLFEPEETALAGYRPGAGRDEEDLDEFHEAVKNYRRPHSRADHHARATLIRSQFPSVAYGKQEFHRIFMERPEVFRAIVRVLLEIDASQDLRPGQGGRRPAVGFADGSRRLGRLFGKTYSELPFDQAFTVLCTGRSLKHVAVKTGLPKSTVHRLQRGLTRPSGVQMEQIAKAFAVHPSYFVEWRIAWTTAAVVHRLEAAPETSMHIYLTLRDGSVPD